MIRASNFTNQNRFSTSSINCISKQKWQLSETTAFNYKRKKKFLLAEHVSPGLLQMYKCNQYIIIPATLSIDWLAPARRLLPFLFISGEPEGSITSFVLQGLASKTLQNDNRLSKTKLDIATFCFYSPTWRLVY